MSGKFFNLDFPIENLDNPGLEKSGAYIENFLSMHGEKIKGLRELTLLPKESEAVFLWTVKSFNAFTFIPYILQESGIITELTISTYSINRRIIDALVRLIDQDKILKFHMIISETLKTRLTNVNDHLSAIVGNHPRMSVRYAWNHSKVALIRSGENYFDVEGSGNWGENAQHEQYVFINSKEIYEFRKREILAVKNDG